MPAEHGEVFLICVKEPGGERPQGLPATGDMYVRVDHLTYPQPTQRPLELTLAAFALSAEEDEDGNEDQEDPSAQQPVDGHGDSQSLPRKDCYAGGPRSSHTEGK